MKTFKLLGVMALLVCAMTIVTGCNNKKDNSEPDSIYPSAESLIGTWSFIDDISNVEILGELGMTIFYFGNGGFSKWGNGGFAVEGEYTYTVATGLLVTKVSEFIFYWNLEKGTEADQMFLVRALEPKRLEMKKISKSDLTDSIIPPQ